MGAFEIAEKYPGATEKVRRSLSQINDHLASRRICEAAGRIGVKAERPTYLKGVDVWAHVAFPERHVAVLLYSSGYMQMHASALRALWEEQGWTLMAVRKHKIDNMNDAELERELRDALGAIKAKKGGKR